MARDLLVQVTFPAANGVAEDSVVNTWAVKADDSFVGDGSDLGEVTIPIFGIYNTAVGVGPAPLSNYMSTVLSRAALAVEMKVFDIDAHLDGSPHGSPIAVDHGTLGAAGGGSCLPSEVAIAVELRTSTWSSSPVELPDGPDVGSEVERPRQRQANRKFIGPWQTTAMHATATVDRPGVSIRDRILAAVDNAQAGLVANGHILGVWSRKNSFVYAAHSAAVDDAWDTQRRRGTGRSAVSTIVL